MENPRDTLESFECKICGNNVEYKEDQPYGHYCECDTCGAKGELDHDAYGARSNHENGQFQNVSKCGACGDALQLTITKHPDKSNTYKIECECGHSGQWAKTEELAVASWSEIN